MRLVLALFLTLTISVLSAQETYHFTVDCTVHALPNSTSAVQANAKADMNVTYLKTMESGAWAKVKFKGKIGYVAIENISAGEFKAKVKKATIEKYHVSIYETHLYSKRSASSAKLATYYKGDMVDVVSSDGEWFRIQDGAQVGYILSSHLAQGAPKEEKTKSISVKTYEVTKGEAKIFSKPNTSSKVLSKHYKGDVVDVIGETKGGQWARVQTASGFGYITFSSIKEVEDTGSSGGGGGGGDSDMIGPGDPSKIGAVCRDGAMVKGNTHDVCAKHNGVLYWIYTQKK